MRYVPEQSLKQYLNSIVSKHRLGSAYKPHNTKYRLIGREIRPKVSL